MEAVLMGNHGKPNPRCHNCGHVVDGPGPFNVLGVLCSDCLDLQSFLGERRMEALAQIISHRARDAVREHYDAEHRTDPDDDR